MEEETSFKFILRKNKIFVVIFLPSASLWAEALALEAEFQLLPQINLSSALGLLAHWLQFLERRKSSKLLIFSALSSLHQLLLSQNLHSYLSSSGGGLEREEKEMIISTYYKFWEMGEKPLQNGGGLLSPQSPDHVFFALLGGQVPSLITIPLSHTSRAQIKKFCWRCKGYSIVIQVFCTHW
jgi:hypothetical protein